MTEMTKIPGNPFYNIEILFITRVPDYLDSSENQARVKTLEGIGMKIEGV